MNEFVSKGLTASDLVCALSSDDLGSPILCELSDALIFRISDVISSASGDARYSDTSSSFTKAAAYSSFRSV